MGRCPLFVFQGPNYGNGTALEAGGRRGGRLRLARVRDAASASPAATVSKCSTCSCGVNPSGMVLRVVIDRPGGGRYRRCRGQRRHRGLPARQPRSQRPARRRGRVRTGGPGEHYTLEVSSPAWIVRCGMRRIIGGSSGGSPSSSPPSRSSGRGRLPDGSRRSRTAWCVLEEGRKTHRVPLAKIKRAQLDVEF